MKADSPARSVVTLYKERVLAEAARELAEKTRRRRDDWLPIFKRFLKLEEHRLRLWHNAGGGGREIARQRADLIDIVFRELFENISHSVAGKETERVVVAAFGGYGRREMNPFSDVDLMFLIDRGQPSARLEDIIRRTLMGLWDLGFKVGHSTRSLAQAVKAANEDMVTKTSMLECRFLLGDRELFQDFKTRFEHDCIEGRESAYVKWRFESQVENHQKYGDTVFMQEPNVKNGCGGLRDYQNLLWISFVTKRLNTTAKLVEHRILRASERAALEKAYDFLLRVRTEMHYLNGRPMDGLTLQLQGRVATAFHYPQKHILRRCEAFMRDYYSSTRDIAQITATALGRLQLAAPAPAKSGLLATLIRPKAKSVRFDGFQARNGQIFPLSREVFNEEPARLMRVFRHAQVRQLDLSMELRDLIRRRLRLIDRTFQYARATREIFLDVLSHKGEVGRILRAMHDLGVLGRYLPEFGALTCLVQHEFFHRYTADEHTLVCIEKLDAVLLSDEKRLAGYRQLFQKLDDPAILYLAVLLHDVGKAANSRHHEEESAILAHKVARRLQLTPERRRMLLTLVDAHFTLSHTAQTRNLEDPETIAEFAGIVKNREKLDSLMLLTLADGMGTSDQNWSDWKESLVWSLYRKTTEFLDAGPRWIEERRRDRESLFTAVSRLLPRDFAEEIEAHFAHMPERYFHAFDADRIVGHLQLFRAFFESRLLPEHEFDPVFAWIERPEMGHSEVWVCGWDRERLLERIAGAFLTAHINILSADIFTRGDSLALDIFRVCDSRLQPITSPRDQKRVENALREALREADYDFTPLIGEPSRLRSYRLSQEAELPTRIVVDSTSHPLYTIVEIQTPDRLGLLYSLLRALGEAGLSIHTSRITTEMEVAMDTFYVTTRDDRKIELPSAIERLQRLLRHAAMPRRSA
jgi:[protein-PII] uridylyltransferase